MISKSVIHDIFDGLLVGEDPRWYQPVSSGEPIYMHGDLPVGVNFNLAMSDLLVHTGEVMTISDMVTLEVRR